MVATAGADDRYQTGGKAQNIAIHIQAAEHHQIAPTFSRVSPKSTAKIRASTPENRLRYYKINAR